MAFCHSPTFFATIGCAGGSPPHNLRSVVSDAPPPRQLLNSQPVHGFMDYQQTARQCLDKYFGFSEFRGCQWPVIRRTLEGRHSILIMPTGGGKSLCFQIPALAIAAEEADRSPLTLVISPLIALMKDQVDGLVKRGIDATFINSSLTRREREKRCKNIVEKKYSILYVTPERFRKAEFREYISKRHVPLLAVDEAHCISEWGHDFRPDYSRLGEIREFLGDPVTIALTATATPDVQEDIVRQLNLQADDIHTFHEGIDRPNLELRVDNVWDADEKQEAMEKIIRRWLQQPEGCGIVYFTLIRTLEEFSERLHKAQLPHVCYHGDLERTVRRAVQDQFMQGEARLALATNAFGMGVDRENIRFVVHADVPGSLESLYQEIGRAGRDGLPSECVLLYDERDLNTQMEFIRWSNPDAEFFQRAWHLLTHSTEQVRAFGIDWLRERLCDRNRHDRRIETVLSLLQRYGTIDDEHCLDALELNGPLPEPLADQEVRSSRLLNDQKRLYALVQYIHSDNRREFLRNYFGVSSADSAELS